MLIRTMMWQPCLSGHDLLIVGDKFDSYSTRYVCKCLFCGRVTIAVIPEKNTVQELKLPQELEDFIKCLLA